MTFFPQTLSGWGALVTGVVALVWAFHTHVAMKLDTPRIPEPQIPSELDDWDEEYKRLTGSYPPFVTKVKAPPSSNFTVYR